MSAEQYEQLCDTIDLAERRRKNVLKFIHLLHDNGIKLDGNISFMDDGFDSIQVNESSYMMSHGVKVRITII